ncbi:MAG: hypothetical protein AB7S38_17375 [Vulcanimicrobiota bacterium]
MASAETALRSRKFTIEQISKSPLDAIAAAPSPAPTPPRVLPRPRGPMPDSYKLATAMVGLVCLVSILRWLTSGSEPKPVVAPPDELKTVVVGRVEKPQADLQVHVVFPELPYEVAAEVDPQTGTFEVPVEVATHRPAGRYHLELSLGPKRWRVRSNQLVQAAPTQAVGQPLDVDPPPEQGSRNRPRHYEPAYSAATTSARPRHDRHQPKRHDRRRRHR